MALSVNNKPADTGTTDVSEAGKKNEKWEAALDSADTSSGKKPQGSIFLQQKASTTDRANTRDDTSSFRGATSDTKTPASLDDYEEIDLSDADTKGIIRYTLKDGSHIEVKKSKTPKLFEQVKSDGKQKEALKSSEKDGYKRADKDTKANDSISDYKVFGEPGEVAPDTIRYENQNGDKVIVTKRDNPQLYKQVKQDFDTFNAVNKSAGEGYKSASKDTKANDHLDDYKYIGWPDEVAPGTIRYENKNGDKVIVTKRDNPDLYDQVVNDYKALKGENKSEDEGYVSAKPDDDKDKNAFPPIGKGVTVGPPNEVGPGTIRYETADGKKVVVSQRDNPDLFKYLSGAHEMLTNPDKRKAVDDASKDATLVEHDGDVPKWDDDTDGNVASLEVDSVKVDDHVATYTYKQDGKEHKAVVSKDLTPSLYNQLKDIKTQRDSVNDSQNNGFELAGANDYMSEHTDPIKQGTVEQPADGVIRYETKSGKKVVVSEYRSPKLYDDVVARLSELGEKSDGDIKKLREKYHLPDTKDMDVLNADTGVKEDKDDDKSSTMTVQEKAINDLLDEYKKLVDDKKIDKNDPRAKFVRAIEAQKATQEGHPFYGLEEDPTGVGNDTWRHTDAQPTNASGADMSSIIDTPQLKKELGELFSDKTIAANYKQKMDSALGTLDGKDGRLDKDKAKQQLVDYLHSDDYQNYLKEMKSSGHEAEAQSDLQQVLSSLSALDPAAANEASQSIQTDSVLSQFDEIMADPSKNVSEENQEQSVKDLYTMLKGIVKGSDDFVRQFDKIMGDMKKLIDDGKSKELYDALVEDNTKGNIGSKYKNTPVGNFLDKARSTGALGGISSLLGLVGGVYQLSANGGKLADTADGRISIAKDFLSFVGTAPHVVKSLASTAKFMGSKGGAELVDFLGGSSWADIMKAGVKPPEGVQDIQSDLDKFEQSLADYQKKLKNAADPKSGTLPPSKEDLTKLTDQLDAIKDKLGKDPDIGSSDKGQALYNEATSIEDKLKSSMADGKTTPSMDQLKKISDDTKTLVSDFSGVADKLKNIGATALDQVGKEFKGIRSSLGKLQESIDSYKKFPVFSDDIKNVNDALASVKEEIDKNNNLTEEDKNKYKAQIENVEETTHAATLDKPLSPNDIDKVEHVISDVGNKVDDSIRDLESHVEKESKALTDALSDVNDFESVLNDAKGEMRTSSLSQNKADELTKKIQDIKEKIGPDSELKDNKDAKNLLGKLDDLEKNLHAGMGMDDVKSITSEAHEFGKSLQKVADKIVGDKVASNSPFSRLMDAAKDKLDKVKRTGGNTDIDQVTGGDTSTPETNTPDTHESPSTYSPDEKTGTSAKRVAVGAAKVVGALADTGGGVLGLVLGAKGVTNAKKEGDNLAVAQSAVDITGGVLGVAGGVAEGVELGVTGGVGAAAGLAVAPLFVATAVLAIVSGIIGFFVEHNKKQKLGDKDGEWFKDLANDGVLQKDWGDKAEFLRYSIHRYGGRDAPQDQSIFDYQSDEWKHFQDTKPEHGSSSNRLDPDLHKNVLNFYGPEFAQQHKDELETIRDRWDDWAHMSGKKDDVSREDLEKIRDDKNSSDEDRKAAELIVGVKDDDDGKTHIADARDHVGDDGFMDVLDTFKHRDSKRDDSIGTGDLERWFAKAAGDESKEGKGLLDDQAPGEAIPDLSQDITQFDHSYYEAHQKEIDTVIKSWDNWNGGDDKVSEKDLNKIKDDSKKSKEERDAADFLLNDGRAFFDYLDTSAKNDKADTKISDNDLNQWKELALNEKTEPKNGGFNNPLMSKL